MKLLVESIQDSRAFGSLRTMNLILVLYLKYCSLRIMDKHSGDIGAKKVFAKRNLKLLITRE
jgi:hypothetical protein